MRILTVRFKNLNSLVGEWEIDLTQPAYASDGIFAITGPTGAGKTTILDAICLALYGRTPRLNKVTKTVNEIMSRQTGECFAEVTFETRAGRFRCHWSQHRSRKKKDGELQAPRHEIADADSGRIFEAKMRGVADQIEAVTGMDFERFTRSMLLAQGGFAAFLQAAPDDRAPILEQITGTAIYSQISIRVHERRTQERKKLDTLQAELTGMQLLSQEEELCLNGSLDQKIQQDADLTLQLSQHNQAVAWLEGITRLEDDLRKLDLVKSALHGRVEAFKPDQERLRLANQALELSAEHAALTSIRQGQASDRDALAACQGSLPVCIDAARQAEEAMQAASEQLVARKTEQQTTLPAIRKACELDLKIIEKDAPVKAARVAVAEQMTALETVRLKQKNDSEDLAGNQQAVVELQTLLAASKMDERLVTELTGLRSRFDMLKELSGQLAAKQHETTLAENQLQEALGVWQEQLGYLNGEKVSLESIQADVTDKQSALLKILDGKELAVWRKNQLSLATRNDLLSKTAEAVSSLANLQLASTQLESRQSVLKQQAVALANTLETELEKQAVLEKELALLETQLTLLKRIEDLEEARHQLQDQEPCPLCGAREHPFAKGNIPVADGTQQRLSVVRKELKSAVGGISNIQVRLAQLTKDIEQTTTSLTVHAAQIGQARQVISDHCSALDIDPKLIQTDAELSETLDRLQEDNSRQFSHATTILGVADAIETELIARRTALEQAKDSVMNRERELLTAAHRKEAVEQLLERLRGEGAGFRQQQTGSFNNLQQELIPYGVPQITCEGIDSVYEQLIVRREQWMFRSNQLSEREQKVAALAMQVDHQVEQILKGENDVKKQQALLAELLSDQETLRIERHELFGDKNAEEEEKRLSDAVDSADKALDAARQQSLSANQAFTQLIARIGELEKSIHARDQQLKSADEAFLARLTSSGFTDEANYQACCLAEAGRKLLTQQAQKLTDEQNEIVAKEREKVQALETERQKKISEASLEHLKSSVAALITSQRELQQEIGGIRQKLNDNGRLKEQQQVRVQAIEAQKCESVRWDLLHELIGSADGKKYRNFAQGLTFEMMVGHANRQLQKMTDRYLLIRDGGQPLELNVIDSYQAGEIRSTKNLSGGESFIVSLSLALGLSQMASKNVRVDSLFLDEGFGTLDEEALDTALETLSGLQQDGKLIGVISHVSALKERISTQIQVIPRSGGKSLISGPGCQHIVRTVS